MKNLKSLMFLTAFLLTLQSTLAQADECRIAGKWKSNEEKTLQNMRSAQLTETQRKRLSSVVFGKLIISYTCKGFVTTYEGKEDAYQFITMKESGDIVTIEMLDPVSNKKIINKLILNGDCYSSHSKGLGFDEVFCRVK
ncbi:MAG: hypothetical protein Q7T25_03305 [Sideroxyarcus sp.]|nr:hypothetical protein [Sideroxyarcus sp.]